ncbi:putative carbonic anhydrase 3 [Drosophila grimshawi]|uniref:GH22005 n=1 Tax=Drosophila grimshawi TaxID=7222 RepID=B4J986_DROGR|nr:putative carbonic anhydrase 3 [Drosophila grimshawi]EDW02461.1 GH22005 [Drosophila grimshawi]
MYTYFSYYYNQVENINWYILIVAIIWAIILIYNLRMGIQLLECLLGCEQICQENAAPVPTSFDYSVRRGPHTWQTAANNQSPINIDGECAEQFCLNNPLMWIGYEELPVGIRLENNGHTLLLHAAFQGETPYIDGADLLGSFSFHEICFRWSWYSGTGSEHTLDNEHFPMEVQCMHKDAVNREQTSSCSLLMVSYMYAVSTENPFLDVLIQHLVAVQEAGKCVEIPPFPLNYLMPAFHTAFYSYHGSLTEPPCHRGAEWFIYPLPLAISERQLHEFRKLRSHNGARIGRNSRPVQPLDDRTVLFNY